MNRPAASTTGGCRRRRVSVGVAVLAAAAYHLVVRPWQLRWGASAEEAKQTLPGDGLITDTGLTATRAITIPVSADAVWEWIAQLGQGRGGFYSYDRLENLVGCDIHSADHIEADLQQVEVGDAINLAPGVALEVAVMERGRSLVLRGGVPIGGATPPYDFTWAFVVCDQLDGTTRLLVRERYGYRRRWAVLLVEPVELISFVMTQKMLRGIQSRAVRASDPGGSGTGPGLSNRGRVLHSHVLGAGSTGGHQERSRRARG